MPMDNKIKKIKEEHAQIEKDLQSPNILGDANKLSKLSKQYNELNGFLETYIKLENNKKNITELKKSLENETDKEMIEMTEEEISNLNDLITKLENEDDEYINPADP